VLKVAQAPGGEDFDLRKTGVHSGWGKTGVLSRLCEAQRARSLEAGLRLRDDNCAL